MKPRTDANGLACEWRARRGMDAVRERASTDGRTQAGGLLMLALSVARYVCVYERLVEAHRSDQRLLLPARATCREGARDIMSCRRGT